MITETLNVVRKNFANPDESRPIGRGELQIVRLGKGVSFTRITLRPGWKWSVDVRPLAQTENCQASHVQYIVSGRLMIAMEDGARTELSAGDAATIPAGHDAWVVGEEPVVAIDFSTEMAQYGRGMPSPNMDAED